MMRLTATRRLKWFAPTPIENNAAPVRGVGVPHPMPLQLAYDRVRPPPRFTGPRANHWVLGAHGSATDVELLSPHSNRDASQGDREPRTQLRAANDHDNPFRVSQPRDAHSSRDGTTGP